MPICQPVEDGCAMMDTLMASYSRIKSDTPLSRFTTLTSIPGLKNIGFHCVWTVAYPLPIDKRDHESKGLLAHHGYSSRLPSSSRGAAGGQYTSSMFPKFYL